MGTHKDDVDMMRQAFKDGAKMMRGALSMPDDPDMAHYQKLSDKDFDDMMKEMGSEPVMEYIKRMEMRGMGIKEKKHAKNG